LQRQLEKPKLSPFDGKDLDMFLAIVAIYRAEVNAMGFSMTVSDLLSAIPAADRASVLKRGETSDITVDKALEVLQEKYRGAAKFQVFSIMRDWFVYRQSGNLHDHFSNIAMMRKKVNGALEEGKEVFPDKVWGWYVLFTSDLSESDMCNLKTMLNGDFSFAKVKQSLMAYYHNMQDKGAVAVRETTLPVAEQTVQKGSGENSIANQISEAIQVALAQGKGKGKGFKPRCRHKANCRTMKTCPFYHTKSEMEAFEAVNVSTERSENGVDL
jgi:hypothetical protein